VDPAGSLQVPRPLLGFKGPLHKGGEWKGGLRWEGDRMEWDGVEMERCKKRGRKVEKSFCPPTFKEPLPPM